MITCSIQIVNAICQDVALQLRVDRAQTDLTSHRHPILSYFKHNEKEHHGYSVLMLEQPFHSVLLRLLSRSSSPNEHRFNGDAIFHVLHCLQIVLNRVEFDHLFDRKLSSLVPLYQIRDILRNKKKESANRSPLSFVGHHDYLFGVYAALH